MTRKRSNSLQCHLRPRVLPVFLDFNQEILQILFSIYLSFPTGLITRTLGPSNDFTLLNGWICLHGVLG